MSSYDKSFPVSWEEIHRNSKALAWRLHDISSFQKSCDNKVDYSCCYCHEIRYEIDVTQYLCNQKKIK